MLRRTPSLLVAIALALPLGPGCTKKQQLTEVKVPEAGVTLRYDLSPGQEYDGHVKMRTSIQTPMGDIVSNLEFDANIAVSGNEVEGGMLVRATVKNLSANTRLPDGMPAGAAGAADAAAGALNGMELRFHLDEFGKVSETPEPPEQAAPEIKQMIGMITSSLTAAFSVRLPEQALKDNGETWDAKSKDQDEDEEIVSATSTGTFKGIGRNEAGDEIAELVYDADITQERSQGEQKFTVKLAVDTEAAFSATGGHPASVKRKINTEIVGQATLLQEVQAEWWKGVKNDVPLVKKGSEVQTEVQSVSDPCDPDYAGMEECVEDAPPPAEEAAPPPAEGDAAKAAEAG